MQGRCEWTRDRKGKGPPQGRCRVINFLFASMRQAQKDANGHNLTPLRVIEQASFQFKASAWSTYLAKPAVFPPEHYQAITKDSSHARRLPSLA